MVKNGRMMVTVMPKKSPTSNRTRHRVHPTRLTSLDFDWSLKPMIIWFKMFGIPPPTVNKDENSHRLLLIPITVMFYVMTIGCNAFVLSQIRWTVGTKNYTSATKDWNSTINQVNFCLLTISTHSALLFASYFMSWNGLTDLLRQLEQYGQFDNTHYHQFRRIIRIGPCLILIEITIELVETLIDRLWIGSTMSPTTHVLFSGLNVVSLMFPYLGSILFCTLGWMASVMFQMMADETDRFVRHELKVTSYVIDGWRRRYFLIVEFVDEISDHLGFVLLVITASEFVRMTNTSFHLLMEFLGHNWTLSTILVAVDYFKETLCFCVLVYVPSRIHRQANDLIRKLRLIEANDLTLQNELRFLAEEMNHSLPNVTPMGMIHINLQLIPTLIGTTLTYLIILCQFQSSETIDNKSV